MSRLPLLLFCSRSTSLHLLKTTSKLSGIYRKRLSSTLSSSPQLINQSPVTSTSTSTIMRRFIRKASSALSSSPPKEKPENGLDSSESYQAAIRTLNTLQSNAATIALIRSNPNLRRSTSLPQTTSALLLSGIPLESLSTLPIIHVAGTKGKGMTCAFTESILRQAGLKTGFFSSPHLTYVRERIRINGQPISEEIFAKKFFQVYNRLKHLQDNPSCSTTEMPPYFRFLTILAFHIFLEESVDVVILEVGIGGRYDSTNIIPAPSVVGITALGLEHQQILGHTLEEIALNKAGIMKPNCPAFTISTHPPQILDLLRTHADQVPCPLEIIDPLDLSSLPLGVYDGPSGVAQQNATLAIHLANQLLLQRHSHIFPKLSMDTTSSLDLPYSQPVNFLPFQTRGLELCQWPGRFQRVEDPDPQNRKKIVWYLDGAHTPESLKCTLDWFNLHTSSSRSLRLLIFNLTGSRCPELLMNPLVTSNIFDLAIFCPFGSSPDNWSALANSEDVESEDPLEPCRKLAKIWENLQTRSKGVCLANAEETMDYVRELCTGENFRVQVLVTGSLHLVGTFLYVLQPELVQNE